MIAQLVNEAVRASIGASRKIHLLALLGTTASLLINLTASAIGCNKPQIPTTLGPRRRWILAMTLTTTAHRPKASILVTLFRVRSQVASQTHVLWQFNLDPLFRDSSYVARIFSYRRQL